MRDRLREPVLFLVVGGVVAIAGNVLLWWLMARGLSPGRANAAAVATTSQLNFLGGRALTWRRRVEGSRLRWWHRWRPPQDQDQDLDRLPALARAAGARPRCRRSPALPAPTRAPGACRLLHPGSGMHGA